MRLSITIKCDRKLESINKGVVLAGGSNGPRSARTGCRGQCCTSPDPQAQTTQPRKDRSQKIQTWAQMKWAEVRRYPSFVLLGTEALVYGMIAICSTSNRTETLVLMQVAKDAQIISIFTIHTLFKTTLFRIDPTSPTLIVVPAMLVGFCVDR